MWLLSCIIIVILYCVLIFFYVRGFKQTEDFESNKFTGETTVAIIIPARNERKNIFNCIDSILNQTYPNYLFGIILIDDFSTDDTVQIAQSFQNENIKIFSLSEFIAKADLKLSHKKIAIENAINQTEADLIVCIDADCTFEKDWLKTIVTFYENTKAKFITAPVLLNPAYSFIQKFQVLDFIGMMITTCAVNFYNIGLMSNGANMAFSRKAFLAINGFEGYRNIISGDDIFLMQKIESQFPNSAKFLKSKKAIATTAPQKTRKSFINQRLRWASKNKKSKDHLLNFQLLIAFFCNFTILINVLITLFYTIIFSHTVFFYLKLLGFQLLLKTIFDYYYLKTGAKYFNQQHLMKQFLPSQICHILYINFVAIYANFGAFNWKGRKF